MIETVGANLLHFFMLPTERCERWLKVGLIIGELLGLFMDIGLAVDAVHWAMRLRSTGYAPTGGDLGFMVLAFLTFFGSYLAPDVIYRSLCRRMLLARWPRSLLVEWTIVGGVIGMTLRLAIVSQPFPSAIEVFRHVISEGGTAGLVLWFFLVFPTALLGLSGAVIGMVLGFSSGAIFRWLSAVGGVTSKS